jgi:hypothetical protein
VVRDLQQYWLFFDDATGLVMSLANTKAEAMPIEFDRVVRCATSVEDVDGNEVIYFGSDDGFVFRFNSGNSFDGEMLPYLVRLAFNNLGTPALKKRFKKVALELSTAAQATLLITADFSYGNPDLPSVTAESFTVRGGGGFWDTALWDQFYFSQAEGTAEAHIDGLGTNISVAIAGETDIEDPHTMHGINYYYNLRGKKR